MKTMGKMFLEELESEAGATRKCLERVPIDSLFAWKPHEKSMQMGYLTVLLADMIKWISHIITVGDIDFETWERVNIKTTEELVAYFDKNMEAAKMALEHVSDEELEKNFSLKNKGHVLMTDTKKNTIGSSINHLVHHRGQLTVYMRLNNIPVPPIYGPSADEGKF